jgi:hypothetical protein
VRATYSDLDLIDRGPSARLLCGLGGLEPKKGANLASALAARFEYLGGGGGGGGTGEREPESDIITVRSPFWAHDQERSGELEDRQYGGRGGGGERRSLRHPCLTSTSSSTSCMKHL